MKHLVMMAGLLLPSFKGLAQPEPATPSVSPVAASAAVQIPDTPAGRQLAWFLAALGGNQLEGLDARFSPSFKSQIDPAILARQLPVVGQSILGGGPAQLAALDETSTEHRVAGRIRSAANGTVMTFSIVVDPSSGLIDGLSSQVIPGAAPDAAQTWEALDAKLAERPGTLYLYIAQVADDGAFTPIHARLADARLGTGSTFKLYVLGALAEMVTEGAATWDQVIPIREEWKSLPSGTMQNEPAGAAHTLAEYALKMISISDNTATDHLIEFVGRDRVEAYMSRLNADAARSIPFLKTRELFALKLAEDRTLADRYIAADLETRRAMLAAEGEVGRTTPNMVAAAFWHKPLWIQEIEWFATGEECARAIVEVDRLSRLPGNEPAAAAVRTNPGIGFDRTIWKGIAFKGGSEVGVINLTWLLDRADGKRFVVSFGWNDTQSPVDEQAAVGLAGEAIGLLERVP